MFICTGKCAVFYTRKESGADGPLVTFVEILNPGDSFNDISCLFSDENHKYGVLALEKCALLKLTKEHFPLAADIECENHLRGSAQGRLRFLNEKKSRLNKLKEEDLMKQQIDFFKKYGCDVFKARQQLTKMSTSSNEKQRIFDELKKPIVAASKAEEKKEGADILKMGGGGVGFRNLAGIAGRDGERKNIIDATPRLVSRHGNPEALLARQKLLGTANMLRGSDFVDTNQKHLGGMNNKDAIKGIGSRLLQEEKNDMPDMPLKKSIQKPALAQLSQADSDAKDRNLAMNILSKFNKTNEDLVAKLAAPEAPPSSTQ